MYIDKIKASLILGAIGDCIGSFYEGMEPTDNVDFNKEWFPSDDTQLTLATAEAIIKKKKIDPETIANNFLKWFNKKMLTGLGSSTLQALQGLQVRGHWALVGRQGEFAAGNGAAMRIAPLAFIEKTDRITIRDVCRITHKNDEAYCGALIIYYAVNWSLFENDSLEKLIVKIPDEIPDTKVKDRLLEIVDYQNLSILELGEKYKPTGYVVDSVPFAVFVAPKIQNQSIESIFTDIIKCGGDTDTVCSMTGQIIGANKGMEIIPEGWIEKFKIQQHFKTIEKIIKKWPF